MPIDLCLHEVQRHSLFNRTLQSADRGAAFARIIVVVTRRCEVNPGHPLSRVCSKETCSLGDQFKMCPQCDVCPYWNLSDACVYTKMAYLFDHPGTVFYSIFTAFWGTFVTLCLRNCATHPVASTICCHQPVTRPHLPTKKSIHIS